MVLGTVGDNELDDLTASGDTPWCLLELGKAWSLPVTIWRCRAPKANNSLRFLQDKMC